MFELIIIAGAAIAVLALILWGRRPDRRSSAGRAEPGIEAGGEMNAKKIAEKLREIASFYGPDDGCTNAIYDALIAIANELDPPAKPLLADARVGDLCQRRDGKWVQIDSVSHDRPCPVMCKSDIGGQDCFTLDGRNHNAVNNDKDIIATEPLAEVGSAEWAWQMLMLQKPVSHPAEGEFQDTYPIYTKEGFIRCMAKTGWQLYEEPKPEPQYKVRDWVEFNPGNNPKQVEIVQIDGDKLYYNTMYAGKTIKTHIYASAITRKLDPSEVIVHIGCLSGMVSQCGDKEEEVFALHTKNNAAVIPFAMLDAPTRELVEGLLKAQEEK